MKTISRLGELCSILRGVTFNAESDFRPLGFENSIELLRSNNVKDSSLYLRDTYNLSMEKVNKNQILVEGDSLICMANGSKELVGKSAYIDRSISGKYTFGSFMGALRPNEPETGLFLKYILQSDGFRNHINLILAGSSINNLTPSLIEDYEFEQLDPSKQKEISKMLSDIDDLISLLESEHAKKVRVKTGMAQELLNGKLRMPGFNGEWRETFLFDESMVKARIGWQGLNSAEYLSTGRYGLVGGTDFRDGYINWESIVFVSEDRFHQDPYIKLINNDVLITKDGSIGKVALVKDLRIPSTLNSGVYVIRPRNRSYDSRFAYHLLNSEIFDRFIEKLSAGSTISHLYQRDLKNFCAKIPQNLEEQIAISESLTAMDESILSTATELAKYKRIKQGMAHDLLTGKKELV